MARMTGLFFIIVCLLSAMTEAKVYGRCELAGTLKEGGMNGYRGVSLDNWVCTAYYESHFDSRAIGPSNSNGSRDYGIFQINSQDWCDDGQHPTADGCSKPCSAFINDDISDDIECVKRIVRGSNGMNAWEGWRRNCKGKDVSQWTQDCGV